MANVKQIGDIQIFAELYQGATTLVYKGFQSALERFVLLKVLRPEFSVDDALTQRFQEEAKFIAKIQHPNVVTVFDYGRFENWVYFAAEFVDGCNLNQLIQIKKLPVELAWFILFESAKGLQAAHEKNILHKDIKPSNILISYDGQVKITDFGMASYRAPKSGAQIEEVSGTLAYMTPEHVIGNKLNKYSDIFSLGATFYEMMLGKPAFTGQSDNDYFQAILNNDPTSHFKYLQNIPKEMGAVCKKMLEKKPQNRYQDCLELLSDLESVQSSENYLVDNSALKKYIANPKSYHPEKSAPDAALHKESSQVKNKKPFLLVVVILIVCFAGYLGFRLFSNKQAPDKLNKNVSATLGSPALLSDQPGPMETEKSADTLKQISSIQSTTDIQAPKIQKKKPEGKIEQKPEEAANHSGDSVKISVESAVVKMGYLKIECTPWAQVYLNNDSIGTTPLQKLLELPAGSYQLKLLNPDFPEYKKDIYVQGGETTPFVFSLWSLVGSLKVEVSPWADVFIDDKYRDTIPPQSRRIIVFPGKHILKLKHPGLGVWQTEINVFAGESLDLIFNLNTLLEK